MGIVWELKTVTCKSTCSDPRNKVSCFHLNAESRKLNTLFYRVMHTAHRCQSACLSWHLNAKCSLFLKSAPVSQIHQSLPWHWVNEISLVSTPNTYSVKPVHLDVTQNLAHLNC